jgi:hypothetical protein
MSKTVQISDTFSAISSRFDSFFSQDKSLLTGRACVAHQSYQDPKRAASPTMFDWKSKASVSPCRFCDKQQKNESHNLSLISKPRPSHTRYVPATRDATFMTCNKLIFIFSRDNPLSNASNLLPTDPITALYALPGSSISTWQVGGVRRRNNARHRA